MVAVPSTMLDIGSNAPGFELLDVRTREKVKLSDQPEATGTLVMFICNHCPYVKHIYEKLAEVCNRTQENGVNVYAISSNDVHHYPDDSPEKMKELAESFGFQFPYLYDQTQEVAHAYRASCTPDFYLFDKDLKLAYRGQFDNSRPGSDIPVTGEDLESAIKLILASKFIDPSTQKPSIGCNIKWKPGNEPEYFSS